MMTSVLMLPAILHLLGPRINKFALPVLQRRIGSDEGRSWWYAFSHFVMRNARIVLLGTLLLLLLLGLPTQGMKLGLPDARALPASAESRQVQEVMRAQFAAADLSPLMISVRGEGKVTQPKVLAGLYALTREIEAMPGVIKVSGLASLDPGLGLADYEMLYQFPAQFPVAAAALAEFDRGEETRLMVFYSWLPQSEEAQALVRSVRALEPPAGIAEFHVAGYPAFHRDYMDSLHKWVPITVAATQDRYKFRTSPLRNVGVQPTFMHNGAFTSLEDAVRHHLEVFASARNYTPASQQLAADLSGPTGPVDPVLARVDPILAAPIILSNAQFDQLIAFVRHGLLDPRATPEHLRRLVPPSVPSSRPMLTFEFLAGDPG